MLISSTVTGCGKSDRPFMPKGVPITPIPDPKPEKDSFQIAPDQINAKESEIPADLSPHLVGSAWSYRETAGDQNNLVELKAEKGLKPEEFGIVTSRNGEVVLRETYQMTATSLLRNAAGFPVIGKIVPPMPVLHLPPTANETWNWIGEIVYPDGSFKGNATFTLHDLELVETPAGSFKAYRVSQDFTLNVSGAKQQATSIQWYAPGVGVIKMENGGGDQKTQATLKSYKLTKP